MHDGGKMMDPFAEVLREANTAMKSPWLTPDVIDPERARVFFDLEDRLSIPDADHTYQEVASNFTALVEEFGYPPYNAFVSVFEQCVIQQRWGGYREVGFTLAEEPVITEILGKQSSNIDWLRPIGDDYSYEQFEGFEARGDQMVLVRVHRLRHRTENGIKEILLRQPSNTVPAAEGTRVAIDKQPMELVETYDWSTLGVTGYKLALCAGAKEA